MDHRVAVWAYRAELGDWINLVFLPDRCEWTQMMNMDYPSTGRAIYVFEVHFAHSALCTILLYALLTSTSVSFIRVYDDLAHRAFVEFAGVEHFFWLDWQERTFRFRQVTRPWKWFLQHSLQILDKARRVCPSERRTTLTRGCFYDVCVVRCK